MVRNKRLSPKLKGLFTGEGHSAGSFAVMLSPWASFRLGAPGLYSAGLLNNHVTEGKEGGHQSGISWYCCSQLGSLRTWLIVLYLRRLGYEMTLILNFQQYCRGQE